ETLLQKSMQLLQQSIDENRSLSRRLSPPTRNGMKLADSVQELVDTVAVARKFEISLQATAICDLQVSEALHIALYRILQEQLTNITRHANASLVHVAVKKEGDRLSLNVTDNGRGFDTSQKRTGIGITNMRMRAENLGGTLSIRSRQGQGCILLATFPLSHHTPGH
ncbi:MAG TPA: ATP-binding protein, partial [Flavisolibacter sp.]|nr:ATP-binding protein [Flavisolibacter sp.]